MRGSLRLPGGKTIVGNECSTVGGGKRRWAMAKRRRRMKAVTDEEKAIDDGEEDREKRSLMDSGTKLTPAAKYLNIIGLLDLTRRTVAYMIIDKTLEDMCTNIKNDYTPEEETEVRKEHGLSSDFWSLVMLKTVGQDELKASSRLLSFFVDYFNNIALLQLTGVPRLLPAAPVETIWSHFQRSSPPHWRDVSGTFRRETVQPLLPLIGTSTMCLQCDPCVSEAVGFLRINR
ncbi:hypothetical protein F2Q70_00041899, partial [Brassica cretica]